MGIHDRDYYQEDPPAGFLVGGGSRTMVTRLVIVTVAVSLIDIFTPPTPDRDGYWLSNVLALQADVYRRPWEIWNLLSYGFAHAPLGKPGGVFHVGLNMFLLWMFGRVMESRVGPREFLLFYLAAIVFAGVVWVLAENLWWLGASAGSGAVAAGRGRHVVGASGGVTAVFLWFVFCYPRQTVYVWGLLAVPAWLIGALAIGTDLLTAVGQRSSTVAWQAHLGGAAFAFLYWRRGWTLSRWGGWFRRWRPAGPTRLRIHRPGADDSRLDEEADRILDKLHREGERSLTGRERRVLEQYSRRMREKRQR